MGNQQYAQTPATLQTSTNVVATKPKASSFDPVHPMGIPAVDTAQQGPCRAAPANAGCVLDPDQRRALVALFNVRVLEVHSNCTAALQLIKVQKLIKKSDELPWYAGVLLDVVAAILTDGLSLLATAGVRAASGALGRGAAALAETAIAGIDVEKMRALVSIAEPPSSGARTAAGIKKVIGATVNAAKGAAKPHVAGVLPDSSAAEETTAATGYINYLEDAIDQKFDGLTRTAPGVTTDIELRTLYESLDPKFHTIASYEARFRAAVDLYVHSHAAKIGRRTAWDPRHDNSRVELETRVAWLITRGAGKRLIYVDRAFSASIERQSRDAHVGLSRGSAYDSGANQLSLEEDGTWETANRQETRHEKPLGPDLMLNYVEPELADVALETQKQVWLTPPETFMLDYSYAPPRMIKVAS